MKIIIGTRGSKLALVQSRAVGKMLEDAGASVEFKVIKTIGDTLDVALTELGGKGVFVKEIDEALLSGSIDVAIHSMKDVPADLPAGVSIAAVPVREDARDAFVSNISPKFSALPKGARVGTSSPRRRALLLKMRPDLQIIPMRGNVDTRLKKLKDGEVEAVILAAAGLNRLGIGKVVTEFLPLDKMIPAIGQGALAIEVRSSDDEIKKFVNRVCHHNATAIAVRAERSLLKATGGDCHTPLAAYAEIKPSGLHLNAFAMTPDETRSAFDRESGQLGDAAEMGKRLAKRLLEKLGVECLKG